jgi:hypothetical protein
MSRGIKMHRFLKVVMVFLLTSFACQTDHSIVASDHAPGTPVWLKAKIDSISTLPEYFGTKIYRYEWNWNYIYHMEIPISSCGYCECYDQSGRKIDFSNEERFRDFLQNRRNQVLIWEWEAKSGA